MVVVGLTLIRLRFERQMELLKGYQLGDRHLGGFNQRGIPSGRGCRTGTGEQRGGKQVKQGNQAGE